MKKQLKRSVAIAIMLVNLILMPILAIYNSSDKASQNSTPSEQQEVTIVEEDTTSEYETVTQLMLSIESMEMQISYAEEQIFLLQQENAKLKEENTQLLEENIQLKETTSTIEKQNEEIDNQNHVLTDKEWEILYRVARSEAGSWSKTGQKNVVYVVLNRIYSERFKENTIKDVVFAPGQFAVISNKSYYNVEITDFVKENVREAVNDYIPLQSAEGALFFTLGSFNREYLFTDEVGHNFYK